MHRDGSRLLSLVTIAFVLASLASCERTSNPEVASTGLELALELRVDNGAVLEHYSALREGLSLEKGKLKFKELRDDELDTKSWCFMKYSMGDSLWGIVPGTQRDCTDDDDDDAKRRAKRRAKRWLNKETQAQEERSEIDYLITDGWYERALKVAAQSASTGFDFGACVRDAVEVATDLARRQSESRCKALMDNEEMDVVELLGERGLDRLGVDLLNVDDEDTEKAMKRYLGKLGELKGVEGATFLMLTNEGWGTACFESARLDEGEAARASVMGSAVELCAEVSEGIAQGR